MQYTSAEYVCNDPVGWQRLLAITQPKCHTLQMTAATSAVEWQQTNGETAFQMHEGCCAQAVAGC
jgi:hypothetical protein